MWLLLLVRAQGSLQWIWLFWLWLLMVCVPRLAYVGFGFG
jgi:hypothetical protein